MKTNSKSPEIVTTHTTGAADAELIKKTAAGDRRAFEQIYWRHHQKVYLIALRMTKNAAEAEEVTQKVFLKLFRQIGSFQGETLFSVWLHRLTINEVLTHFRRHRSRREYPKPRFLHQMNNKLVR